jgi:hypothetical protein
MIPKSAKRVANANDAAVMYLKVFLKAATRHLSFPETLLNQFSFILGKLFISRLGFTLRLYMCSSKHCQYT